jgi:hypothetical protein
VGGEHLTEHADMRVSGVDFYKTIQQTYLLGAVYRMAERKAFDTYEVGKKLTFGLSKTFGVMHNGVLPRYLAWCLLGLLVLFYVLTRTPQ